MNIQINPIPCKIKDDGLTETIVLVKYNSEYTIQKLQTVIFTYLTRTTHGAFQKVYTRKKDRLVTGDNSRRNDFFYTDGKYKVVVRQTDISFNCVEVYPGWATYFSFIRNCLNNLQTLINGVQISIRYISSYPELPLSAFLEGHIVYTNLSHSILQQQHTIHCKLATGSHIGSAIGIIRLYDSIKVHHQIMSIVDIEIQSREVIEGEENYASILQKIELCHNFEKQLFFSLLTKEFIDSKQPIYEE